MNEFKQGYDSGWADCLKDKRERERGVLEEACRERGLPIDGGHRDLLAHIIHFEIGVAIDQMRASYAMTPAQRR